MGKGLLAWWRRRIVARGLAGAVLFAVPVAVAALIGFGTSLSGVAGGLSAVTSGPERRPRLGARLDHQPPQPRRRGARQQASSSPRLDGGTGGGGTTEHRRRWLDRRRWWRLVHDRRPRAINIPSTPSVQLPRRR